VAKIPPEESVHTMTSPLAWLALLLQKAAALFPTTNGAVIWRLIPVEK
jgi:hypothetical protein